eukprot:9329308-Ditylum_brightwellii.AAC.1
MVIMDNTFLYATEDDTMFAILRCVCKLAQEKNLTWKLKKCSWFPSVVEFVGVDVSAKGNLPVQSKMLRLKTWKEPSPPRDIMSFIRFSIFYMQWILLFEIKITPLQELLKECQLDHILTPGQFSDEHMKPNNDKESLEAMKQEISGGDREFDIGTKSKMRLLPVTYGSRRTKGNKRHYHSHP